MRFQPPLWAWTLTLCGVALFVVLGNWQLNRGDRKQQWIDHVGGLDRQDPVVLSMQLPPPEDGLPLPVRASGRYLPDRQLLADGHSHDGRPGYQVWTPLRLESGGLVLVNRGWVPQPAPEALAAPSGPVEVRGYWRDLPVPGLRLAAPDCAPPPDFPAVVLYPDGEQLRCLLGEPVAAGLLLLSPEAPGGYVREWAAGGLSPERHYGYALQWYALALTAVVLFIVLNLKRKA
jgi:surfeit locus 1 family protein